SGLDAELFDGQTPAFYAKASQVLTNVPAGAVFTDTWRSVSDSVISSSSTTSASSKAAKTAYDRGTSALNVANTKLNASAQAVDSAKLDGQSSAYYAKASQVLTNVPENAVFTDTQRAVSSSVSSASTSVAANSAAVKTAYDRGTSALNVANTKLDASAQAVDSNMLNGQTAAFYAKASQVLTDVPVDAKFTDTQRPLSSSVTSASTNVAATSNAAKIAYDRGSSALSVANTKLDSNAQAVDSDKLDGQHGSYYAKASQVLTDVPEGAVFTDTQRPLSSSVSSTSTSVAATSKAVKSAYDRGTEALSVANTKLDSDAQAVDSDKLDGQSSAYYAKASQVLTDVPAGAVFTDTWRGVHNGLTSTSSAVSLSANQGRVLKGLIDTINGVLESDDDNLATVQDIVTFVNTNRSLIESLDLNDVSGLSNALSGKLDATAKAKDADKLDGHDSAYFARASQVLTDVPAGAKFTDTQRAVVDSLTSTSTSASLTANQGRVLKGLIDNLSSIIGTSDGSLDSLQEIVDFIKQNKDDLESLTISNIAGLQTALDSKLPVNGIAKSSLALESVDSRSVVDEPKDKEDRALSFDFKYSASVDNPGSSATETYAHVLTVAGWDTAGGSGGWPSQVSIGNRGISIRAGLSATTWSPWAEVWTSHNDGSGSGLDADKLDGQHGS
ncbi:MAG: tail fiber protein, partial [Psychrobacter sp.]